MKTFPPRVPAPVEVPEGLTPEVWEWLAGDAADVERRNPYIKFVLTFEEEAQLYAQHAGEITRNWLALDPVDARPPVLQRIEARRERQAAFDAMCRERAPYWKSLGKR
jgi:hypothetical protein